MQQLNKICELYSSDLGEARSVKQEDINEITGIVTPEKIKEDRDEKVRDYDWQ